MSRLAFISAVFAAVAIDGDISVSGTTKTNQLQSTAYACIRPDGTPTGCSMVSYRAADDPSPDFTFVAPPRDIGMPIINVRSGGVSGPVVLGSYSDGTVTGGNQAGYAAFVDSAAVSGHVALTCNTGSGQGCYTVVAGQLKNESLHGALTVVSRYHQDGGLLLELRSDSARHESPGGAVSTTSIYGDQTLWGGTIQPFFQNVLPHCGDGATSRFGEKVGEGSMAWLQDPGCLYVCAGEAAGWKFIVCK